MFVALDIATKTGCAFWRPGWDKPRSLVFDLPPGEENLGRACAKLHRELHGLHTTIGEIERIIYEQPIPPSGREGVTTLQTMGRLLGLIAHAESFAHVIDARCRWVNQGTWRKEFIGRGSGVKTKVFKEMCLERCRKLGWNPADHNAADALGILHYALIMAGVATPWRDQHLFHVDPV